MKQDKLMDAIGRLPDDLLEEAEAFRGSPRQRHPGRLWLRSLIAAVLTVSLAFGTLAAYRRWHMPERPEGFHGDGIETHTVSTYPVPPEPAAPSEAETAHSEPVPSQHTDAWFLSEAQEVLRIVRREAPDATEVEVVRQKNLWWNREEVEVFWKLEEGTGPCVKFDAETGYLIGVTAFGDPGAEGPAMSEEEALQTAEAYYQALPYARGYTYRHVEKICDTAWMYYFDRPVTVAVGTETMTLPSDYEQVRITINPCSGSFELSNCFYVPLLDDHEPGEPPLTKEQAIELADQRGYLYFPTDSYEVDAHIGIALPNPESMAFYQETEPAPETDTDRTETQSAQMPENVPYSDVTRLSWILTFHREPDPDALFEDIVQICVDLYTGEILSVDVTR